ncbi:MAG TPA: M23 family metallopeptidase [Aggregatilineaceae bacterium]|nr:M23 family metallopeptidase [Aggregatilineaceae bacterium]
MKRVLIFIFVLGLVFGTHASAQTSRATIMYDFQWIRQGEVGLVRVNGTDIAEVRAVFQQRVYNFYPDQGEFIGLISADMVEPVDTYTLQVWINYTDGTAERIDKDIEVNYGEFGTYEVTISGSLMNLLEPSVNEAENNKLANLLERFTPERYWTGGFIAPSTQEVIGPFGTNRLYNGTYWYQHSGTDYKVGTGSPVIACASGRVVLSQMMSIRGGYVLIDHGWGVYSGYAHMSERFVVPGQWVRQGDTVGLTGNNGRSSGAHLHWEIAVGGVYVNPEKFQALGLEVNE